MEVACTNSGAINEGSSEVTCTTGRVYSFSKEPSCSDSGENFLISRFQSTNIMALTDPSPKILNLLWVSSKWLRTRKSASQAEDTVWMQ